MKAESLLCFQPVEKGWPAAGVPSWSLPTDWVLLLAVHSGRWSQETWGMAALGHWGKRSLENEFFEALVLEENVT